jgi:hypothetical protein
VSRYAVQVRTVHTVWETESTYLTKADATRAYIDVAKREPTNDDGDSLEYRVVDLDGGAVCSRCWVRR